MTRYRLDQALVKQGLVASRSQAESWIKLGKVNINGQPASKPGQMVDSSAKIELTATEKYVSRAGLKLASVAKIFKLNFKDKIVLDVGSSTGGFTDFALQHGAKKVIAVDVGTDQLHPNLRTDKRVELFEKTDIRNFKPGSKPDIVVMDVSFVSLRHILPHIAEISGDNTQIVAMLKPQFEADKNQVQKGVIKNKTVRREILHNFEAWAKTRFVIIDKADSSVAGASGNLERFYLLKTIR